MILALDSSTESGCAALVDGTRILKEVEFAGGRARIGGGASSALKEFSGDRVDGVIVGIGPGSYNGIRASVAAAWGFATARGIPLYGASSLLALAPGEYIAAGNARQGHYFFALVRDQEFVIEPMLVSFEELAKKVSAQSGIPVLVTSGGLENLESARTSVPSPALLAGLATGDAVPATDIPKPIYLKPPHITQPRSAIPARMASILPDQTAES